ncbi:D-3-phosphoglycerate dehydrogenase [Brachionus plicatilis]|uniref:D-3-phosphoglycerate dehydrogenase n=1 Tax=Brachionus plicatilis TaxID=10195 RepID=A0A3M7QWR2_BRAPC|nr:D-3-phosphoglycerate dehydrogenase [Brachionus plicatilis]
MALNNIKNVLISDDVNAKCVEILQNNGFNVVKNTSLSIDQLKQEIKNYDCLVVRSATKVTKEVLNSGVGSLKLVARAGTGVDNIDCVSASDLNILVMNAVGSNTISAAELTCAMISGLARNLQLANQSMKDGKWERSKFMGTELYGKTLAVLGLGRIGREVASRMRAFGMRIIGYDPIVKAEDAAQWNIESMSLEQIWPQADYITVHVPFMPETKNLINAEVMSKCKRGFRLVNCARGGIIEENDLLQALNSGQCAGAGLDVFAEEPTKNFDLVRHNNVICTPHLGASSIEAQNRVAVDIAEQIVKFVKFGKLEGGDELRLDGRAPNDYRPIKVEFNKINNSYGSCQLILGDTKVIAAVKAELDTPDAFTPDFGKLDFFVDCSANAAPEFQGRGGEQIASQIVNILSNLFSPKNFDLTQLNIVSGKKCWHLYVDIVLLESSGNLYDACALATKLALARARFPRLATKSDDEGQIEIDFADEDEEAMQLNVDNLPHSVSVCKIGNNYVVDSDLKEESVTKVRITFGFDDKGNIRYTSKDGFGSLDPDSLYSIVDIAKNSSKKLQEFYLEAISRIDDKYFSN